jgi:dimethylargininase
VSTVRTALIRRPGPRLAEGLVTHIERVAIDEQLAERQWLEYVGALQSAGWDLLEVSPADDCPDAVFIEDTVVLFGGLAVITRPGAETRRGEILATEKVVDELQLSVNRIHPPGTLDGGDVLKVGDTVYVGRGGRTNGEGVRQLRRILEPFGHRVVGVPLSKVLHLKSAVTALPDGTIVGYRPLVDDPAVFPHFLAVPEESGSHVVCLSEDHLLTAADCPRSIAMFEDLGYHVTAVDITEFQKLEGCVTCLSVRIRVPVG